MKAKEMFRLSVLVILVVFAVNGIMVVSQYIGYASFQGESGNIYEIVIKHHIPVDQWAGLYGVGVRFDGYTILQNEFLAGGDVEQENLLFDCLEPGIPHEIYASIHDEIDLSSFTPATVGEVDSYYGIDPGEIDSVTNTFLSTITWEIGTTSISAPGVYTYKLDEGTPYATFATAGFKDADDKIVFAILITSNITDGFNGQPINFQGMLPVFTNISTTEYFFFTDPNDLCPAGQGDAPETSNLIGTVTNQGGFFLEDVIVEVSGVAGLTDVNGFYNISPPIGVHRIYGIKEGYKPYNNNVTIISNTTAVHDFIMIDDVEETLTGIGPGQDEPGDGVGPGVDVGPGQSDGEDVGPGEAPAVPYTEEPKQIEGTDYIISLSELKRKIRIDSFHQEAMYIYSFKKTPVALTFTLNGENLSNIITLDKEQLIVDPDGNDQVIITIWGRPPTGTYTGNLTIDGEFNATIPVEIEVLPRDMLPVEALLMNLETNQKSVLPGREFKFKTDLRNLLIDQQYPVSLLFTIQPIEGGDTIWSYQTNVFLKTAFSLIRTVQLPKDLEPGDYVLRVSASYLDLSSSTDTIFNIAIPFWSKVTFGLRNWIWALIIGTLLAAGIAGFLIWRNIQGKKKYHLKVEYSELPKPGPRNIFVGKIAETENKTYMNLENFKVHTIVAGSTGGGKSVSAQVIVEEALDRDVAVICFDPTAQWTGMLRACKDKTMLSLYPFFGMKKTEARAYNGNIRMITNPKEQIDIRKYAKPGEIQVFAAHKLDPKDMDIVVANAIREIFHANFEESKPLKILFVFDEVHRLLPKFGGSGDGFLQIERGCREFRKWGLGIVLVSQVLSDFVGTIKANINTEIQMRTRDEGDLERIRQKYGEDVLRSLVKATVGSGMVENPAYNRGKPYFVAFRPLKHSVERLTDEEIEQYNKYNDLVDELEYSLEQLEEFKVDVFDLKLELKLALDKVKQGNFNMVQIYLEGLTPRIDKQWEKLGKKPKKYERKLVDGAALKEELKKAQEERDKYVEENTEEKKEEKKEWEWTDDAPPDKLLSLKNGMVVLSLANLYDEISAMKENDWDQEVNEQENRIADWVESATGLTNLANNLRATIVQDETVALLKKFKDGEKLPEVKAAEAPKPAAAQQPESEDTKPEETASEAPTPQAESSPETPSPAKEIQSGTPTAPEKTTGDAKSSEATEAETQEPAEPTAPPEPAQANTPPAPSDQSQEAEAAKAPAPQPVSEPTAPEESAPVQTSVSVVETPQTESQDTEAQVPAPEKTEESPTPVPQEAETPAGIPPEHARPSQRGNTETIDVPASTTTQQEKVAAVENFEKEEAPLDLEALVASNPAEYFRLENGLEIKSVKELAEYLPTMDDSMFHNHVGDGYNHFADWVRGVFHDDKLAEQLAHAKSKDEMLAVIG